MGELNRQQHTALGGTFSTDALFGGFIADLENIYNPGKAEQTAGKCYEAMANFLDSLARRLSNVSGLVVYLDSADGEQEFSVRAGNVAYNGHWIEYAGETAVGDLSRGATNYIWLDLSSAPSASVAFGASWPSTPHIRLASIAMPASGAWLPSHITRLGGAQAIAAFGVATGGIKADLTHASDATTLIGTLTAGDVSSRVVVWVEEAFDGSAPTLTVGDAADNDRLAGTTDLDLKTVGRYEIPICYRFTAATAVNAYLTPDGSTAGKVTVKVEML